MNSLEEDYKHRVMDAISKIPTESVSRLADAVLDAWERKRQVFLIGNGGSAGNAIHLANDFLYGVCKQLGSGIRVHALTANSSILTCLANDEGYENIFSHQLQVHANPGDILIALSGSGNSPNILRALEIAAKLEIESYAVLGFNGGKAKFLAKYPIHCEVDDMQISEDIQLIIGHMIMQRIYKSNKNKLLSEGNK